MNANMTLATTQLNSNSEDKEDEDSSEEGKNFKECDESIYTGDDDLSEGKYDSDVDKVSSGIFDAEHGKKYETHKTSYRHCGMRQGRQWEAC